MDSNQYPPLTRRSTPTCAPGTAKSRDSLPRSRLRLEAGLEPAWSVSQTDCEVPARFAPGRNIQLCHKREHHRRPGATRTRIDGLGHRCPDPLDDEPWRRGGSRTRPAVLRTASRPASPAPCPRADSNGRPRGSEPRALSTAPRGHKVRREGLEPPCGMPDLQSGAVAAAPPTLGVTSQDRTGSLRDHRPALCRLSYSHRAQRRNRTSVPWVWTRCSPIELAEPARSRRDLNPQSLDS